MSWPLRAITLHFADPEGPEEKPEEGLDCTGCPAPCCRGIDYLVPLTLDEAGRLPYQRFTANRPGPDGTRIQINNLVGLPRREGSNDCIFLDGGCGIYANRPRVCREYDCRYDPEQQDIALARFGRCTVPREEE